MKTIEKAKENLWGLNPKNLILLLGLFFIFYAMGCSNEPVMSELVNSRVSVVLKGTYLSNGVETKQGSLLTNQYGSLTGNAAVSNADSASFKLYLDIAEVRLASGTGPGSNPSKYWQYFANERIVMCDGTTSTYNSKTFATCSRTGGEQKLSDFLTGNGVTVNATDVEAKTYNHLALYIRRFVSYPSINYDSSGNKESDRTTTFDNQITYGVNSGAFYFYAPSDNTSSDTPRLFPLENKNLSLTIPDNDDSYVLEVRIAMNKVLMKHLYKTDDGGYISFIGPSNWLKGVYDGSGKLGGNFAITGRIYQPGNTGEISGTGSQIYAVMPAGTTLTAKMLPIAAAKGTIKNLEPGSYDVYKVTLSSATGFAQSVSSCATSVTVTAGGNTTASGC